MKTAWRLLLFLQVHLCSPDTLTLLGQDLERTARSQSLILLATSTTWSLVVVLQNSRVDMLVISLPATSHPVVLAT